MADDDIIDHLLSIEQEADALVKQTQNDSDRILRDAEHEERTKHENALSDKRQQLTSELSKHRSELESKRNTEIAAYEAGLRDRPIDGESARSVIGETLEEMIKERSS